MSFMSASIARNMSELALIPVLLMFSGSAFGQSPQIKSGATLYIEPMGGYETYLAAALMKEKVPVVIVTQKEQASYIVTGSVVHNQPGTPEVVVNNTATASVTVERDDRGGNAGTARAFQQGFASGQERAAERRAAKAALGNSDATISIMDAKSTQIVFAYSSGKGGGNQFQKTAEDCAKHLGEAIKKAEKKG